MRLLGGDEPRGGASYGKAFDAGAPVHPKLKKDPRSATFAQVKALEFWSE